MDIKDLQNRFTHRPVSDEQESKYKQIRINALNFAILINDLVVDGREKSLSVTALEECVNFAINGIERETRG